MRTMLEWPLIHGKQVTAPTRHTARHRYPRGAGPLPAYRCSTPEAQPDVRTPVHARAASARAPLPVVRLWPVASVAVRRRRPGSTELLHALAAGLPPAARR